MSRCRHNSNDYFNRWELLIFRGYLITQLIIQLIRDLFGRG